MSNKENIQEEKILNNLMDLNIDLDFYFSEEGREPNDAILEIYSNLLLESGLFEEQPTYSKFEDRTSGVDGYLISDKDLHLFKTSLSKDDNQINNLTSKGIDTAHNKLIRFFAKSFNDDLRKSKNSIKLTVDKDIQFLIRKQLIKYQEIFRGD